MFTQVSIMQILLDLNYYLILGCIVFFLLLVAVATMTFRSYTHSGSKSLSKSDKFHEIGGICSPQDERSLHNYNYTTFDSPKVDYSTKEESFYDFIFQVTRAEEFVKPKKGDKKEDWDSRQWNQESYKEPYKRNKKVE